MSIILKAIINLLVVAFALIGIAHFVPGVSIAGFYTALIVALLWGLVSLLLKPVLSLLTLPINLLTLGLFSFVVNALLFWFLSSFVAGFAIAGFIPALEGSILLSLVIWVLHKIW